ncbi:hypothetical protein GWN49_03755 [Candidatus Bathyarchaeota archaeon]|nr:hypothetical protein [Candidatus Bathyarchaeota archaeon]
MPLKFKNKVRIKIKINMETLNPVRLSVLNDKERPPTSAAKRQLTKLPLV